MLPFWVGLFARLSFLYVPFLLFFNTQALFLVEPEETRIPHTLKPYNICCLEKTLKISVLCNPAKTILETGRTGTFGILSYGRI